MTTVLCATLKVTGTGNKRRIPWIVMTSDATDSATRAFFEEKAFFGLEKSQARLWNHKLISVRDFVTRVRFYC